MAQFKYITMDGTEIDLSSGDLTIDVAGEIILDADTQGEGNGILLKDAGTTYGNIFRTGSDLVIMSSASDEDLIFNGNDGGSTITALTLDMSAAGAATFNARVVAPTHNVSSASGTYVQNFEEHQNFKYEMSGNVTLNNPSTETAGQSGHMIFIQDGTGSRTLSIGTDYETAGGAGITLSTAANATDIVPYVVLSANRILLGAPQKAFS